MSEYEINALKKAYVDTLVSFSKATVNKVNEGAKLQFFSKNYLYMVPVGEDGSTCAPVEIDGRSPYETGWNYAYVGVVYTGVGYDYYVIAEDGKGTGIPFLTQRELNSNGTNHMYMNENGQNKELSTYLKSKYKITSNDEHNMTALEKEAFSEANVSKIVYISSNTCSYRY